MHIQPGQLSPLLTVTGPFPHKAPGPGWTLYITPRILARPVRWTQLLLSPVYKWGDCGWWREVRTLAQARGGPSLSNLQAPCLVAFSTASPTTWTVKIAVQKDDSKAFWVHHPPKNHSIVEWCPGPFTCWEGAMEMQPCMRRRVTQRPGSPSHVWEPRDSFFFFF